MKFRKRSDVQYCKAQLLPTAVHAEVFVLALEDKQMDSKGNSTSIQTHPVNCFIWRIHLLIVT